MKKTFVWGLWLLLMASAFLAGFAEKPCEDKGLINEYEGIIRFHVIANSDSEEDQKLKLLVRDYVVERLQKALEDSLDIG